MKTNSIFLIFFFTLIISGCQRPGKEPKKTTEIFKVTGASLPDTFLLGSHLCRLPMPPMEEMLMDMDNLKWLKEKYGSSVLFLVMEAQPIIRIQI
jgi:hypothetical protein